MDKPSHVVRQMVERVPTIRPITKPDSGGGLPVLTGFETVTYTGEEVRNWLLACARTLEDVGE